MFLRVLHRESQQDFLCLKFITTSDAGLILFSALFTYQIITRRGINIKLQLLKFKFTAKMRRTRRCRSLSSTPQYGRPSVSVQKQCTFCYVSQEERDIGIVVSITGTRGRNNAANARAELFTCNPSPSCVDHTF